MAIYMQTKAKNRQQFTVMCVIRVIPFFLVIRVISVFPYFIVKLEYGLSLDFLW